MTVRSFVLRQNPAYRPGGSRIVSLLAVIVAAACAPQIPRQEPTPAVPIPVVEAPRAASSWRLSPSLLSADYTVEQRAVIQTTSDSGVVTDTTALTTEFSLRRTADGGVAGLVQSVLLALPGSRPQPLPGLSFPLAYSASPLPRGVMVAPVARLVAGADPCRSPAEAPLGVIRDIVVQLPDSVSIGTTWSDSGTYRTCRDGAVLTVNTRRAFRVRAFASDSADGTLSVERTSRTSLKGFAARGDDTTSVEGSGSGTLTMVVHARTGAVLTAAGSGSLDVVVRGKVKSERARQLVESRVSRRSR